jgi:DNA-binding MarR family transcriptional regulator
MAQIFSTESVQNIENELYLLEALVVTPDTTQADLAAQVGIAVGTVNWYLKRWAKKGYVNVQRISRWQWRYLLTPEGLVRKRQLTSAYINASFVLYRRIRHEARHLLSEVLQHDIDQVGLIGDDEIVDICRLTCLELQLQVVELPIARHSTASCKEIGVPVLSVDGIELSLTWPSHLICM